MDSRRRENDEKNIDRQKSHWILYDFTRSNKNIIGFDEISPDLAKISLDLREITPESGFFHRILENFGQNLEIFAGILKFWLEFGNLSVSSGFRGGKQKPDPPESSSGGEDPPK